MNILCHIYFLTEGNICNLKEDTFKIFMRHLLYQVGSLLYVRSLNLSLHFALLQISTFHIVDLITQLLLHASHNIIHAMDSLPFMVTQYHIVDMSAN